MTSGQHAVRRILIGSVLAMTIGCASSGRVGRLENELRVIDTRSRAIEDNSMESKREVENALLKVEELRRQISDVAKVLEQKRSVDEKARADLVAKLDALQKQLTDIQDKLSKL